VLSAWGEAMALDDLPASLTGGFVGRAFGFERAVLEPLWSEDGLSRAAAGEMGLTYTPRREADLRTGRRATDHALRRIR
jgi:hypothetical protein